jgi:myosin heavy subunit
MPSLARNDVSLLAMQIQYNITRIEEWCKSHGMPEGTLQLEHLMQATKLLQLKKVRRASVSRVCSTQSSLKFVGNRSRH